MDNDTRIMNTVGIRNVNPRIFAYTDDMDNATLIRFLDYLAARDTTFYAKARKFRKANGLQTDPGD